MKAGDILPNGATVLAAESTRVLAVSGGVQPYVIWSVDQHGNTYWGAYFRDLETAWTQYKEKVSEDKALRFNLI